MESVTGADYRRLKKNRNKKKIVLLDTPEHGNIGDQAIACAELAFIKSMFPRIPLCEFTQMEYVLLNKKIKNNLRKDDVVCIHGGGFIGSLWPQEETFFLDILNRFKEYKIIVFPQTIYFENSLCGDEQKRELHDRLEGCVKITLFVRDKISYDIAVMNRLLPQEKCSLVPDIVTWVTPQLQMDREKKVLFCLRGDIEKDRSDKWIDEAKKYLDMQGISYMVTDTVIDKKVKKQDREIIVEQKLWEFSKCRLVITDRLHGMIFSAITGTPCIALDNLSKKVSGGYEWLKYLEYIRCVEESGCNKDLLREMMELKTRRYSNKELQMYYKMIANKIGQYLSCE